MARTLKGTVECRQTASGITFYARFTAHERRWKIKLGDTVSGMTATRAEEALQAIVSDVRRGRWLPERSEQQRPSEATQSFHELASQWLEDRRSDLSDNGYKDYNWQLTKHLLPFFHKHYPLEITASEIDRLRSGLLAKGLSATSVNKCIRLLDRVECRRRPSLISRVRSSQSSTGAIRAAWPAGLGRRPRDASDGCRRSA